MLFNDFFISKKKDLNNFNAGQIYNNSKMKSPSIAVASSRNSSSNVLHFESYSLIDAVRSKSLANVLYLLNKATTDCMEIDIDTGQNALHIAAMENVWYAIEPLVDAGVDIESEDRDGETPLAKGIADIITTNSMFSILTLIYIIYFHNLFNYCLYLHSNGL